MNVANLAVIDVKYFGEVVTPFGILLLAAEHPLDHHRLRLFVDDVEVTDRDDRHTEIALGAAVRLAVVADVHAGLHRSVESREAVLVARAAGVALDDEPVVTGDPVEVGVDHGLQRFTLHPVGFRYDPLCGQSGLQCLDAERSLTRFPGEAGVALTGNEPLGFGHLVPLNLQSQGHYGLFVAQHHGAEITRLALHRIEIAPLNGAQARDAFPNALPLGNDDRVLRLPEAYPEIAGLGLVTRHRSEIGIQMALEAIAVALLRVGHPAHENQRQ